MEEWRDIKGYEGLYQVSNYGRVKSLNYNHTGEERILKPGKVGKTVYYKVILCKDGKTYNKWVHRLVAQAFIPNPDNLPEVNHKDENGLNNRVDNLEWCTRTYNNNYGTRIQRVSKPVYQYTLDGKLAKIWPSVMEIVRQLGYSQGTISMCCRGKRPTAYGYVWKYIE